MKLFDDDMERVEGEKSRMGMRGGRGGCWLVEVGLEDDMKEEVDWDVL